MGKEKNKQVEGEDPITIDEEAPAWAAGIEDAKEIMSACLTAAEEVWSDHGKDDFTKFLPTLAYDQVVSRPIDQNVTNLAIAMYQSIVMMEIERGRIDALKMHNLIPQPGLVRDLRGPQR